MKKIIIHSAPRSGSTWLSNIFNSAPSVTYKCQPLFCYDFKGALSENSNQCTIEKFFNDIYHSKNRYLNQLDEIDKGNIPTFKKSKKTTHIVYKETRYHYILDNLLQKSDAHLIGLIRNPLTQLASFIKAPSEFKEGWKISEEWKYAPKKNEGNRENYFGYKKWKEIAELFNYLHKKYTDKRVTLITYNELLNDPLSLTRTLFSKLDIPLGDQTKLFIKKSTSTNHHEPYSVFRNKKQDTVSSIIPDECIEYIKNDLKGTSFYKLFFNT